MSFNEIYTSPKFKMSLIPSKRKQPVQQLDTHDKIVQSSVELFNKRGVQNVTLRDIASDANVSIGNLTYYFKKKNDLIYATLEILRDRLAIALARPVNAESFEYSGEYLIRIYRAFWEYRFYFNALHFLTSEDRRLREEYLEFRDWLIDTIATDLSYLNKRGIWRKPALPNTFRQQAKNIWRMWLSWLRMYELDRDSEKISLNEALYDCALHHLTMNQAWMEPKASRDLFKYIQNALLIDVGENGKQKAKPRVAKAAKTN